MRTRDQGPSMIVIRVLLVATWGSALVSATIDIYLGHWSALVPAMVACVAVSGWFTAVNQWDAWRRVAHRLAEEIEESGGNR